MTRSPSRQDAAGPPASRIGWVERGRVPDPLVRAGIRKLCEQRLQDIHAADAAESARETEDFIRTLATAELAPVPELANQQHYEVPAAFFREVLGPHLKYSSAWWPDGVDDLAAAEALALAATAERAQLADGQRILELGCGWGSLTLWMAQRFPASRIVAVSNSAPQRRFIEGRARERGLTNIEVHTADISGWQPPRTGFDRVVSVECFEHLRNYAELFRRIRGWLKPDGALFTHVFCHRDYAYPFEAEGESNWMGRHFFTGGIMPSEDLFGRFDDDLTVAARWRVNGRHYARTSRLWLDNLDANRAAAEAVLAADLGPSSAKRQAERWRMFFMACEELFAYRGGEEWFVTHQLLRPRPRPR
jgi:cyclopropane-fatty-acyl-phospholipid synthase